MISIVNEIFEKIGKLTEMYRSPYIMKDIRSN